MSRSLRARLHLLSIATLLLAALLAGCGGGKSTTFAAPPRPRAGQTALDLFYVITENYYNLYTPETAPFPAASQLSSSQYPAPVSYETRVQEPAGFGGLAYQSEQGVLTWAQADPRVNIISGAAPGSQRVRVILVNSIEYGGISNIIGLTVLVSSSPGYDLYVAALDPTSGVPLSVMDIARTLTHELGHVFGLGHSPGPRDLMYYRANPQQGATRRTFLTYGDALAIWTTLNARRINWYPDRPAISYPSRRFAPVEGRGAPAARISDADGVVVDIYPR